jgi:hypothetical protein
LAGHGVDLPEAFFFFKLPLVLEVGTSMVPATSWYLPIKALSSIRQGCVDNFGLSLAKSEELAKVKFDFVQNCGDSEHGVKSFAFNKYCDQAERDVRGNSKVVLKAKSIEVSSALNVSIEKINSEHRSHHSKKPFPP